MNGSNFIIIEMTRRCPGDLYGYPVKYQTGIEYGEWIVRAETGMGIEGLEEKEESGYYGRHCIMGDKNGRVQKITISEEIAENIVDKITFWKENDPVDNYMVCKFGILFLKYETEKEMLDKTVRLNELVRVDI